MIIADLIENILGVVDTITLTPVDGTGLSRIIEAIL